jgi:hypothetical protein
MNDHLNTMLRFILSTLWKIYILFFTIHVLSHWSEVETLFERCRSPEASPLGKPSDQCKDSYYNLFRKILTFVSAAGGAALASVLEVVNFVIFIGKRSVFYVKSKTFYDRYLEDRYNGYQA